MELSIFMAFEMGRGSKVTVCWGQEGVLKARKIGVLGPLSLFTLLWPQVQAGSPTKI